MVSRFEAEGTVDEIKISSQGARVNEPEETKEPEVLIEREVPFTLE